jgi:hypothetical protein
MTSSARERSGVGTSSPFSDFEVDDHSYLAGVCTGKSAGILTLEDAPPYTRLTGKVG